jgi:DNA repair exonuclease SbcCD ATPase subunit
VEVEGKRGGAEPWLNVPKTKRKAGMESESAGNSSLMKKAVQKLMKELQAKGKECAELQQKLEEERHMRLEAESKLAALGIGLSKMEQSPATDFQAVQRQLSTKFEEVYNARLLVRQLEEELITLKKAYAQSAPEGPARADFVRHVKSAVAKHCTAHEAVEEAKDLHDAEPLLEMLGAEQKRFQALCTTVDREHPVKLLQQYQDQVSGLRNQIAQVGVAASLERSVSGGHVRELLEILAEASRVYNETCEGKPKFKGVRTAPPCDLSNCLDRVPLDSSSLKRVEALRCDAVKPLERDVEEIKTTILDLRDTANSFSQLRQRIEGSSVKAKLQQQLQDIQSTRDILKDEYNMLKKITKEYEDGQSQREAKLTQEIGQITDTVSAQRQIISAKRKSLEEDIAKLTKWETHKAKLYREYQLSLAMRTEVEAVLMPLSRKIQKRQEVVLTSMALLSREKGFLDDVGRLTNHCMRDCKSAVYASLGAAHRDLWEASRMRWDRLKAFFHAEHSTWQCQTEALRAHEAEAHGDPAQQSPTSFHQAVQETTQVLQGLQQQFAQMKSELRPSRAFLAKDPRWQSIVADDFLAEDFWAGSYQAADDLK